VLFVTNCPSRGVTLYFYSVTPTTPMIAVFVTIITIITRNRYIYIRLYMELVIF